MNGTNRMRPRTRHRYPRHPIWAVLRQQGRYNLVWLAAGTRYSHSHVKAIAAGFSPAGPVFRARCAALLGLDEAELFVQADTSSAPPPSEDGASIRAGTAVEAVYGASDPASRRSA